jgi:hypothetical protein
MISRDHDALEPSYMSWSKCGVLLMHVENPSPDITARSTRVFSYFLILEDYLQRNKMKMRVLFGEHLDMILHSSPTHKY